VNDAQTPGTQTPGSQNSGPQTHSPQNHGSQNHSPQNHGPQTQNHPRKHGVEGVVSSLLAYGNSHTVKLYQPSGQLLFKLPLTWAAVLGVFALFTPLFIPTLIAVAVLLVLKFRFSLTRDAGTPPTKQD
jgi:hypothetical protein